MGIARTIAIKRYFKRHGIKTTWVAASIGMDEALLRYHINTGLNSPILVKKIKALIRAHAQALLDDLDEILD